MPQQPLSTIKALAVMHFSLLIGQLMFAAIVLYLNYTQVVESVIKSKEMLLLIVPGLIGFSILFAIVSFFTFKKKIEFLKNNELSVTEKLTAYRAASIIRWAMLEAPVLLAIMVFLLTGIFFLWGLIAVMLVLFIYTKPTIAKTAAELDISEAEVK